MKKYTSNYERPGKVKAETKKGKRVYSNGHIYIMSKQNIWKELY